MNYVPTFPDGEAITAGPFNAQQAPILGICENCEQPITIGQDFCVTYRYKLGCGMQTGRLAMLPHAETKLDPQSGQAVPIYYHEDCSAEYAHDHITKEPCGGEDDEDRACAFCGVRLQGDDEP